jgi:hypothetical protein
MEPPGQLEVAEQAAKALGITKLVPTIYKDVLQPAARVTGRKLVIVAKAVGIALAPLEGAVWGYERTKDWLSAKVAARLANKPAEEIKPAELVIAGPILLNMAFASEAPHLREMYANLLASAMHAPTASRVHPSFVQIIQQLTPAEAQILREIATNYSSGSVLFREDLAFLGGADEALAGWLQGWSTRPGQSADMSAGGSEILDGWEKLCANCGITERVLTLSFYRNLLRLGILAERIEHIGGKPSLVEGDGLQLVPGYGAKLSSYLELTDYGDLFLDVCVRST